MMGWFLTCEENLVPWQTLDRHDDQVFEGKLLALGMLSSILEVR